MAKLTNRQLTAALKRLVRAQNEVQAAGLLIYGHCDEVYGVTPGEVDNDDFIDAVGGGCGMSDGMTAKQFHESMVEAIARSAK